jgi:hypothetical protein
MPGVPSSKPLKNGNEKNPLCKVELWEIKLLIARMKIYFELEELITKQVAKLTRPCPDEDVKK